MFHNKINNIFEKKISITKSTLIKKPKKYVNISEETSILFDPHSRNK